MHPHHVSILVLLAVSLVLNLGFIVMLLWERDPSKPAWGNDPVDPPLL